jgi:hypothetical protein
MDIFTIKKDSETNIFEPLEHIELITNGGKREKGVILNKEEIFPGSHRNELGGFDVNLGDFCKETGILMGDIIKGGR